MRHDPYPEGIREINDAAVYDGKKNCNSTNLLNSLAMAQVVPDGPREEAPQERARLRRPRLYPCPAPADCTCDDTPQNVADARPIIWGARLRRGAVALRAATPSHPPSLFGT